MRQRLLWTIVPLMWATGAWAAGPPAGDDGEDSARQERAIAIFEDAEAQYAAEAYDAAARRFLEAFETYPDPAYLFNVALAFEKSERWHLTVRYLEDLLERFPDLPQRPDVERRLAAARANRAAARVTIDVETVPAGATATLDGDGEATPCTTPCALEIDPGHATVVLTWRGDSRTLSKRVAPGDAWEIRESFELGDGGTSLGVDRTGPAIAWGVGGAALINGVVFGVLASDAHSEGAELAARSPLDDADYGRLDGLRSDVSHHSTVADVSFALALTGAVVGTVLWLTGEPEADATEDGASREAEGSTWTWRF